MCCLSLCIVSPVSLRHFIVIFYPDKNKKQIPTYLPYFFFSHVTRNRFFFFGLRTENLDHHTSLLSDSLWWGVGFVSMIPGISQFSSHWHHVVFRLELETIAFWWVFFVCEFFFSFVMTLQTMTYYVLFSYYLSFSLSVFSVRRTKQCAVFLILPFFSSSSVVTLRTVQRVSFSDYLFFYVIWNDPTDNTRSTIFSSCKSQRCSTPFLQFFFAS